MASTSEPAKPTISGEHPRPRGGRREPLLWRGLRKVWYAMGPGFITGASDDDPSGIATYSQTGAHYGYALLWTAVWQLPLLYYTQEAVARIGAVRGKGLASAIREHYGLPLAAAGGAGGGGRHDQRRRGHRRGRRQRPPGAADKHKGPDRPDHHPGARVCGVRGLPPLRQHPQVPRAVPARLPGHGVRGLTPWGTVLKSTFVPHIQLTTSFLFLLVGTFGTTITAYCWFWQSDQEVEEELADRMIGPDGKVDEQQLTPFLKRVKTDTKIGTGWAEVVQWAIIVTCATVLFSHGVTNITTAAQAAAERYSFTNPNPMLIAMIVRMMIASVVSPTKADTTAVLIRRISNGLWNWFRRIFSGRAP